MIVKTAPLDDLIASKLIRYDEIDQSDIQYLCAQMNIEYRDIEEAVRGLPSPFRNLEMDMRMWQEKPNDPS